MRNLVIILFSACIAFQLHAETEREFFSRLVDALPKASPGEFKTPESVARYFVQAILDNQVQDTFRCLPLSRMYAADNFENEMKFIGNVYNARNGLPDDDYLRYQKLLLYYDYEPIQKIRIGLLVAINPSVTNRLERLQQPEDKDPVAVDKWVKKLSNDLSFRNLTNATISSVTSEQTKGPEVKDFGVLPFKDAHKVTVHVSVRGVDYPVEVAVGSVEGNYQIHMVFGIMEPSGSRKRN